MTEKIQHTSRCNSVSAKFLIGIRTTVTGKLPVTFGVHFVTPQVPLLSAIMLSVCRLSPLYTDRMRAAAAGHDRDVATVTLQLLLLLAHQPTLLHLLLSSAGEQERLLLRAGEN